MPRVSKPGEVVALFGAALRRARLRAGMTQEEAAFRMRTELVYQLYLEHGRRNVTLVTAQRAARAVGSSLASLLAGTKKRRRRG